jgi:ribosomal protein L18E
MRLGKQRGPYSKDAMPMGPHRTSTQPVNVAALEERFDAGAEVTLEALVEKGLIKNTRIDVKLLGQGELKKQLSITVHAASASAREKVEAAGGSLTLLREPKERSPKRRPQSERPPAKAEPEQDEPQAEAEPDQEPEPEPDPEPEPEGEEG